MDVNLDFGGPTRSLQGYNAATLQCLRLGKRGERGVFALIGSVGLLKLARLQYSNSAVSEAWEAGCRRVPNIDFGGPILEACNATMQQFYIV